MSPINAYDEALCRTHRAEGDYLRVRCSPLKPTTPSWMQKTGTPAKLVELHGCKIEANGIFTVCVMVTDCCMAQVSVPIDTPQAH